MLIVLSPFIILAGIGCLVYIFFDFRFKSFDKTAYLVLGLFLLAIPSMIYCVGIADKIGEKFPVHEIIFDKKEFPDCGVIIEKRLKRFNNKWHNLIATPPPEVREVCRQIE